MGVKSDWDIAKNHELAKILVDNSKVILTYLTEIKSILQRVPAKKPIPFELNNPCKSKHPNGFEGVHLYPLIGYDYKFVVTGHEGIRLE